MWNQQPGVRCEKLDKSSLQICRETAQKKKKPKFRLYVSDGDGSYIREAFIFFKTIISISRLELQISARTLAVCLHLHQTVGSLAAGLLSGAGGGVGSAV